MRLGPIGQKWVCAAGVERSTLHRCGLTGLGLINPFFHSSIGLGRSLFQVDIHIAIYKVQMKIHYNSRIRKRELNEGDLVLREALDINKEHNTGKMTET